MAPPVWVLSVDLQTRTATFQSGLADAAKSARGAFTDIKSGASDMGGRVGSSMSEARHGVILLGEEFGVHLPRGVTTFLASLGPVGAAMEAAFPFLAIAVGATLLLEHLAKMKEAGEALTDSQVKFGTTVQNAFNALDMRIMQAQIRADELKNDHFGALQIQLQLINKQSLADLAHQFDIVARAADETFAKLKTEFYQFGIGSAGAQHALTEFQLQYEDLLSKGNAAAATDLLRGTLATAERVLALQREAANVSPNVKLSDHSRSAESVTLSKDANALKQAGVGWTEKEVQAQERLVLTLRDQLGMEQQVAELKKLDSANATTQTHKTVNAEALEAAKKLAEGQKKTWEAVLRFYRETYKQQVSAIEEGERETVAATKEGTTARLAAIYQAMDEEEALGLQGTAHYKELAQQRNELITKFAEEEKAIQNQAEQEASDDQLKMDQMALAAQREHIAQMDAAVRISAAMRLQQEQNLADAAFAIQNAYYEREIDLLDKSAKDYQNKLREIQDKQKQLAQQHADEMVAIQDKSQQQQNESQLSGLRRLEQETASGLTSVLTRHETFAKMLDGIGEQVVGGMIQNALMSMMALDMTKEREAAAAARKFFLAGASMPFPANIVMAPVLGAMGFASVMAFEGGGIVPGIGKGDIVPAMLTPGEAVLPKGMTEKLARATNDSPGNGHTSHFHYRPTFHVQTVDSDGVRDMLDKHTDEFNRHFKREFRRMNQ